MKLIYKQWLVHHVQYSLGLLSPLMPPVDQNPFQQPCFRFQQPLRHNQEAVSLMTQTQKIHAAVDTGGSTYGAKGTCFVLLDEVHEQSHPVFHVVPRQCPSGKRNSTVFLVQFFFFSPIA